MADIASHTPGPWLNAGRGAGSHIHADKGEVAWLRSYMGIPDEEIDANARLIAAAPDYHAAAVKLVAALDDLVTMTTAERIITGKSTADIRKASDEAITELRAAIAKAKGRS